MQKRLIIDSPKCTGCLLCVDICSGVKMGMFGDQYARIRIQTDEALGLSTPLVCTQCQEHACAEACPMEAIKIDFGLNIYLVDDQACTGCGECVESCPHDGIFLGNDTVLKCDLCGGRPACARACVPGALRWESVGLKTADDAQGQKVGGSAVLGKRSND